MKREDFSGSEKATSSYNAYVEECFQGEVYGEALFRTMAELCEVPERARKFRVLQQLERETKEFLLPAVRKAGSTGDESTGRISEGEVLGAQLAKLPWQDLMRRFQTELAGYVREFEQAEGLAPPGNTDLLQHVTAHERALLDFVTRELAGDERGDSLELVTALLRGPPPA